MFLFENFCQLNDIAFFSKGRLKLRRVFTSYEGGDLSRKRAQYKCITIAWNHKHANSKINQVQDCELLDRRTSMPKMHCKTTHVLL